VFFRSDSSPCLTYQAPSRYLRTQENDSFPGVLPRFRVLLLAHSTRGLTENLCVIRRLQATTLRCSTRSTLRWSLGWCVSSVRGCARALPSNTRLAMQRCVGFLGADRVLVSCVRLRRNLAGNRVSVSDGCAFLNRRAALSRHWTKRPLPCTPRLSAASRGTTCTALAALRSSPLPARPQAPSPCCLHQRPLCLRARPLLPRPRCSQRARRTPAAVAHSRAEPPRLTTAGQRGGSNRRCTFRLDALVAVFQRPRLQLRAIRPRLCPAPFLKSRPSELQRPRIWSAQCSVSVVFLLRFARQSILFVCDSWLELFLKVFVLNTFGSFLCRGQRVCVYRSFYSMSLPYRRLSLCLCLDVCFTPFINRLFLDVVRCACFGWL
jgi:hypothetical protein